jgi:hypothetical protein
MTMTKANGNLGRGLKQAHTSFHMLYIHQIIHIGLTIAYFHNLIHTNKQINKYVWETDESMTIYLVHMYNTIYNLTRV